ncbi:hypothetical protein ACW2Q0_11520 [Nocardia sp. R16R-3T]
MSGRLAAATSNHIVLVNRIVEADGVCDASSMYPPTDKFRRPDRPAEPDR